MSAAYKAVTIAVGKIVPKQMQPFWHHPAGYSTMTITLLPRVGVEVRRLTAKYSPQTIFFWAPTFKWGLVIAGLADYARPAEQLSVTQSTALAATGTIWARYSTVIIPKNWNLFAVNLFLGFTGFWQLARIYRHRQSLEANEGK